MTKHDSARPPTKADLAEAKDLDRRFSEVMSRKDLDAAMDCFWAGPDQIVMLFGNVQRGSEEFQYRLAD